MFPKQNKPGLCDKCFLTCYKFSAIKPIHAKLKNLSLSLMFPERDVTSLFQGEQNNPLRHDSSRRDLLSCSSHVPTMDSVTSWSGRFTPFQSEVNFHDVRKSLQGQEVTSFCREQLSGKERMSSQGDLGFAVYLHEVCADDSFKSLHLSSCVK